MERAKIDLITGFLGAGKTTFIKKYFHSGLLNPEKTMILENEFGRSGVDAEALRQESARVLQLEGGCICCGNKVDFQEMLIAAGKRYERVIVEPSGIYTLEDFYDIVEKPEVAQYCEVGCIIVIVDPQQLENLDEASRKVIYSQIAGAGQILVSKISVRDVDEVQVQRKLQEILDNFGNEDRSVADYIIYKEWDAFEPEDFLKLQNCGYRRNRKPLQKEDHRNLFADVTVFPEFDSGTELAAFLHRVVDGEYGSVIRVKGYAGCKDGKNYEINCTPGDFCLVENPGARLSGVNVIGHGLNDERLYQDTRAW